MDCFSCTSASGLASPFCCDFNTQQAARCTIWIHAYECTHTVPYFLACMDAGWTVCEIVQLPTIISHQATICASTECFTTQFGASCCCHDHVVFQLLFADQGSSESQTCQYGIPVNVLVSNAQAEGMKRGWLFSAERRVTLQLFQSELQCCRWSKHS